MKRGKKGFDEKKVPVIGKLNEIFLSTNDKDTHAFSTPTKKRNELKTLLSFSTPLSFPYQSFSFDFPLATVYVCRKKISQRCNIGRNFHEQVKYSTNLAFLSCFSFTSLNCCSPLPLPSGKHFLEVFYSITISRTCLTKELRWKKITFSLEFNIFCCSSSLNYP